MCYISLNVMLILAHSDKCNVQSNKTPITLVESLIQLNRRSACRLTRELLFLAAMPLRVAHGNLLQFSQATN